MAGRDLQAEAAAIGPSYLARVWARKVHFEATDKMTVAELRVAQATADEVAGLIEAAYGALPVDAFGLISLPTSLPAFRDQPHGPVDRGVEVLEVIGVSLKKATGRMPFGLLAITEA